MKRIAWIMRMMMVAEGEKRLLLVWRMYGM
jgi:hypothetical protein